LLAPIFVKSRAWTFAALPSSGLVVGGGSVVGATVVGGGATVVGGGATVVGVIVVGGGASVVGGGGVTVIVGGGTVTVVTGGFVVVVVSGGVVVVVVAGAIDVDGGCVGTATLSLFESPSRSARNAIRPMIQSASTPPATIRAAVTYCFPSSRPASEDQVGARASTARRSCR
jgi:hypothetical protein